MAAMIGDWRQLVRREYIGGNPRFDFPVRPLGWAKLIGVFIVGFGVLFLWSPVQSVWQSVCKIRAGDSDMGNIFGLFPLIFVVAASVPMLIGLLILFGRCRVEWRDGRLCAAEILGPFRWTRRFPRVPVRKLEVAAATSKTADSPPKQFERFSALAALFEDGKKKLLVVGYPKDWLLGVAEELKSYVGGSYSGGTHVEVVETTDRDEADEDFLRQPADSRVQVEERGSDVRLVVPPAGISRGSKGLFFFAILWCGFMVAFTTLMFSSKPTGNAAVGIAFVLAFWGIGIGLLTAAINMGKRTALLVAEGGRLRVETKTLFGTKQWEWSRSEIIAIRAGRSGVEVNERPIIELQVYPRTGKKIGLLGGRKEDELRWMATRLRHVLNLPAREAEK